jgi:transposase
VIQITSQTRVLVAVEPADFRCGIDGLAQVCRVVLNADPFAGAVVVFCNRLRTAVRLLHYDGQGFWLCTKLLSKGKFRWWPACSEATTTLRAHELQVLISAGDPSATRAAPVWRQLTA